MEPNSFEEKAFGCLFGAFVADSCGSYLEFTEKYATQAEVDECMAMNGGGPHKVAPGQITDDSEMAIALM